ncbi:MAG: cytochrome b/b6 domain-containing protein [Myxococcales bacterium]|nr:cytochrome b/b6 domain-containing protein [Myxococcales bacterium]
MKKRVMFPRWLRLWHWLNAVLFSVLIVTGFSLHFAGSGSVGVGFRVSFLVHNVLGIGLVAAFVGYLAAMLITGHWRQYLPRRTILGDALKQVRFYIFGILRGEHHPFVAVPERRFNPVQQLAYVFAVFVLIPAQIVTGLLLLFPDLAPAQVLGLGGVWPMALAHSLVAYASCAFLFVHLYLALTVGEPHTGVASMLLGDRIPPPPPPATTPKAARAERA